MSTCSFKKVAIILFTVIGALLVGAAIVLFVASPYIVQNQVRDYFASKQIADTTSATFLNQESTVTAYIMAVSNGADVLKNGATPIMVQKGPYVYKRVQRKFNVSTSTDQASVQFRQWNEYTLLSGTDTDLVTVINPNYPNRVSGSGKHSTFLYHHLVSFWNSLNNDLFGRINNDFLVALRHASFPYYYGAVSTILSAAPFNLSPTQIAVQWASLGTLGGVTFSNSPYAGALQGVLDGFEIQTYYAAAGAPLSSGQIALLLSTASADASISLVSATGSFNWAYALDGVTAFKSTFINKLGSVTSTGFATGDQAYTIVTSYLLAKSNTTAFGSAPFFTLVSSAMFSAAGISPGTGADAPQNWGDLGYYQFGQGLVTLSMNPQWISLVSLNIPYIPKPLEWVNWATKVANLPVSYRTMTLTQVKAFFAITSNITTFAAFTEQLVVLQTDSSATQWNSFVSRFGALLPTSVTASYALATPFLNAIKTFTYDYLPDDQGILPELRFSFKGWTVDADGRLTSNGGFLVRRTVRQVLFDFGTDPSSNAPSYAGVLQGPLFTSQDAYANSFGNAQPPFIKKGTGKGRTWNQGSILSYNDKTSLTYQADYLPNTCASCVLWKSPELIFGAQDGISWAGLTDDTEHAQSVSVFDPSSVRVLSYLYAGSASSKGLSTRRYELTAPTYYNASKAVANSNYYMNRGDGLMPLATTNPSNLDLLLSAPHFLYSSAQVSGSVAGLSPSQSAHSSFIEIHPQSGKTVVSKRRFQVNVGLSQSMFNVPAFGRIVSTGDRYIPLAWVEEQYSMADSDASSYAAASSDYTSPVQTACIVLLVFGVLAIIASALVNFEIICAKQNDKSDVVTNATVVPV